MPRQEPDWTPREGLKNTGLTGPDNWPGGVCPWLGEPRTYTPPDKRYPRLTMVVRSNGPEPGRATTVKLSLSIKEAVDVWWTSHGIPVALLGDAIEMLQEAQERLAGSSGGDGAQE